MAVQINLNQRGTEDTEKLFPFPWEKLPALLCPLGGLAARAKTVFPVDRAEYMSLCTGRPGGENNYCL
jgi:hypothetical protein